MKKLFFLLLVLAPTAQAQPSSPGIVEQSIINERAQDSIEKSYDRMEKERDALSPSASVNPPEPLQTPSPATTPSNITGSTEAAPSAEVAPPASSKNSAGNYGECNRKIFMQLRIIENQRRKIQELQRQLEKRK